MTSGVHSRPTAGVVIIGNEVLSGKVVERNIAVFVRRFRDLGIDLQRVAIITDAIDDIASTVASFSARFDIVCTSGGIGPTHDDLTIDAVARGMQRAAAPHPTLLALIEAHVGSGMNEGYRRMARAPDPCELVGEARWPTIKVDNVFIFPGVPTLLERKFEALAAAGFFRGAPIWTGEITVAAQESDVVVALDACVSRHQDCDIGSYPQLQSDATWNLRLTVEGMSEPRVVAALLDLESIFSALVIGKSLPTSSAMPREQPGEA